MLADYVLERLRYPDEPSRRLADGPLRQLGGVASPLAADPQPVERFVGLRALRGLPQALELSGGELGDGRPRGSQPLRLESVDEREIAGRRGLALDLGAPLG